jgi:phosphohistidine swiveling domain-containing protein
MYTKEFTRDFSIIMEEVWFYALSEGLWDKLRVEAPEGWPNIFFIKNGVIEVWTDNSYIQKIMQAIYGRQGDIGFFSGLFKEYEELNLVLNDPTTADRKYFETLWDAVSIFSIFWYGIQEERINPELKKAFVALRDKDTIYDTCDKITRARIRKRYPDLGKELTTVLLAEFYNGLPKTKVLKDRLESFVLVPGFCEKVMKLEDFAGANKITLEKFDKPEDGVLRGIVAQPGNAVGKAIIIRRKDEINKMGKGDIMVSPMTTPDVFSAMAKASAVVTDEGGMLSHAAIICRELKIPCIIGTKVASEIYKDGDILEVDAENGTVRRI